MKNAKVLPSDVSCAVSAVTANDSAVAAAAFVTHAQVSWAMGEPAALQHDAEGGRAAGAALRAGLLSAALQLHCKCFQSSLFLTVLLPCRCCEATCCT